MVELAYFIAYAMCQYVPESPTVAVKSHSRNVSVEIVKLTQKLRCVFFNIIVHDLIFSTRCSLQAHTTVASEKEACV